MELPPVPQQITEEVVSYQNQIKKLPKSLRDWEAYLELKQTVDDFLELQPVLELLAVPAVKDRHWKEIMKISGCQWRLDAAPALPRTATALPHTASVVVCAGAMGRDWRRGWERKAQTNNNSVQEGQSRQLHNHCCAADNWLCTLDCVESTFSTRSAKCPKRRPPDCSKEKL